MRGAEVVVVSLAMLYVSSQTLLPVLSWSVQKMSDVMVPANVMSFPQAPSYTSSKYLNPYT